MTVSERPLYNSIDIQTPDYSTRGFVIGFSRVGDSLGSGVVVESWKTWIKNVREIHIRRGGSRRGVGILTDVGTLSFTLVKDQDPMAGGTFQPGQYIRVVAKIGGVTTPLFSGTVSPVSAAYPLNKATGTITPTVTVRAVDAVKTHVGTMRYGVSISGADFETLEQRINRLTESARAPIAAPVPGTGKVVYAL